MCLLSVTWHIAEINEIPLRCWDFYVYACVSCEQGTGLGKGQFCFELQRKLNTSHDEITRPSPFRTTLSLCPTPNLSLTIPHTTIHEVLPSSSKNFSRRFTLSLLFQVSSYFTQATSPERNYIQSCPGSPHTDGIVIS